MVDRFVSALDESEKIIRDACYELRSTFDDQTLEALPRVIVPFYRERAQANERLIRMILNSKIRIEPREKIRKIDNNGHSSKRNSKEDSILSGSGHHCQNSMETPKNPRIDMNLDNNGHSSKHNSKYGSTLFGSGYHCQNSMETPEQPRVDMNSDNNGHSSKPHSNDSAALFGFNYHCYYCKNQDDAFASAADVYKHWLEMHSASESNPFAFKITCLANCYYCYDYFGTFKALRDHHAKMHFNEVFAIVGIQNDRQCGFCAYQGDEIKQHTKSLHDAVNELDLENAIALNTASLNELLRDEMQKKVQKLYLPCCKMTTSDESVFAKHFQLHPQNLKCGPCDMGFTSLRDLVFHDVTVHKIMDPFEKRRTEFKKQLKILYLQTEAHFKNGLVLSMQNLLGSELSKVVEIDQLIEKMASLEFQKCNNAASGSNAK